MVTTPEPTTLEGLEIKECHGPVSRGLWAGLQREPRKFGQVDKCEREDLGKEKYKLMDCGKMSALYHVLASVSRTISV